VERVQSLRSLGRQWIWRKEEKEKVKGSFLEGVGRR
jgi:hypothetical protein